MSTTDDEDDLPTWLREQAPWAIGHAVNRIGPAEHQALAVKELMQKCSDAADLIQSQAETISALNSRATPPVNADPVAYGEDIDGRIVSARRDMSRHCTVPLYRTPPAPNGWQPIETAPKDGTEVLLVYPADGKTFLNARYGVGSLTYWDGKEMLWDWPHTLRPTHWIPLPAAPAEARDE